LFPSRSVCRNSNTVLQIRNCWQFWHGSDWIYRA
jgi:hypothetical protein